MPAAPKPWNQSNGPSGASPLGNSHASDGQPKPWQTASTVVAGDSQAPTLDGQPAPTSERPWEVSQHNTATQPGGFGASNQAVTPYGGVAQQYGANGYRSAVVPQSPYGTGYNTNTLGSGGYGTSGHGGGLYGGMGGGLGASNYGGLGGALGASNYGGMYGSSMMGARSMYGQNSSPYGSMYVNTGGMYGNSGSMYGGGMYGGGMYGNSGGMYGQQSMYGNTGGMYGNSGGMYGQQGMGMGGPGMGGQMQVGPDGQPIGPPVQMTRWERVMHGMNGFMQFFGRLSFLVDENTHAVHFFITALLQLMDRAGFLYGEVARFVLRLLGFKRSVDGPQPAPPPCPAVPVIQAAPLSQPHTANTGIANNLETAWSSTSKPASTAGNPHYR